MRLSRHGLATLLLTLLAVAAPAGPVVGDAPTAAAPGIVNQHALLAEIRAVLDDEHAVRAELSRRFRAARHETSATAIRAEIARAEFEAEVAVLRVQAKHARADGREAVAAFLEGAIRAMQSPPVHLPVEARPVPSLRTLPESSEVPRPRAGR